MKIKDLIGQEKKYLGRKVIVTNISDNEENFIIGIKGILCVPFRPQEMLESFGEKPIFGLRNINNINDIYNLYANDEIEFIDGGQ